MKKVININFQGRVVPIEESAYETLQQYIASLRTYFAGEEGRDEIINDIESRIGELFAEHLKKGSSCITDEDVEAVMNNMGRPQDFDRAEEETNTAKPPNSLGDDAYQGEAYQQHTGKKRLYRDEEDKILGGVSSGLANYLNLDPAIMRIIFAITAFFGGLGFLTYIVLWIALPSKSLVNNIRKRLYRDADDKVIGGVCGGLSKYFDINVALPRIIFAAPFIFGLITTIGHNFFFNGSVYVGGFGGSTFIIAYIILWIVLPEALTASEKLEMKGEKVDLNSIRNTIMEDMKGFKGRAEKFGKTMVETTKTMGDKAAADAKNFGQTIGKTAAGMAADTNYAIRRNKGGLGNAIGILFKAFIIFIAGIIALSLFAGLIFVLGSGLNRLPLKDFILEGYWQNIYAWGTLLFFVGVPVVGFITWLIRRLMKAKKGGKYIGLSFGVLWTVGWACLIFLLASVNRSFSSQVGKQNEVTITQPSHGRLLVTLENKNLQTYDNWFDFDGAISIDKDSIYLNTVRLNVVRSSDSNFHVHLIKISKGNNKAEAQSRVEKINFTITQKDSVLLLPESFAVSKTDKWRNQRILVIIEVPIGQLIRIDESLNDYDYFNMNFGGNRNRNWRGNWSRNWESGENWQSNRDMIMTPDHLELRYKTTQEKQWDDTNSNSNDEQPTPNTKAPKVKTKTDTLSTQTTNGNKQAALLPIFENETASEKLLTTPIFTSPILLSTEIM